MLRWQPYKVFDWVWLRHDFTKLKATRQPQHLNSVTRSVSPCLDLFSCRLWASHPPTGLDQQHCTWRSHGCVLAGLSPTALKTATHTHLPIETTRSWECVCVCTHSLSLLREVWAAQAVNELRDSGWQRYKNEARYWQMETKFRSIYMEYRCIKIKMQSWVYNSENWQTFSIH